MPESYREMEARHDALDDQMHRPLLDGRWAGPVEYVSVAAPDPARVRDCTNCCYAGSLPEGSVEVIGNTESGYWCKAHQRAVFADGKAGCSGWPWDLREEEQH